MVLEIQLPIYEIEFLEKNYKIEKNCHRNNRNIVLLLAPRILCFKRTAAEVIMSIFGSVFFLNFLVKNTI